MSRFSGIPSAWDDDYESVADSKTAPIPSQVLPQSRAERKAAHQASNVRLWDSAENPEPYNFLAARPGTVISRGASAPTITAFQPQLKVLSRKPAAVNQRQAAQDEEDSEEEANRLAALSLKERQEKARVEREEKEKKYKEVRARLFGNSEGSNSVAEQEASTRSRGASPNVRRGGNRRFGDGSGRNANSAAGSTASSTNQSPARTPNPTQTQKKELYDPDYSVKPGNISIQRREQTGSPALGQPTRQPRGPDGSGRGGAGFVNRGRGGGLSKT